MVERASIKTLGQRIMANSATQCVALHQNQTLYLSYLLYKLARMKIVSYTEARNSLKTVLDDVIRDADATVISRRDAEDAVVMSLEYYNSLMETVYLLRTPANVEHLDRSIAQYKTGRVVQRELVSE